MSQEIVIDVNNLSKVYKLYDKPIDRLKESLHPFKKKYHNDFYALEDISFSVNKGDAIGIVGQNGSGKSTLLKILAGVLTASKGEAKVNGRVSALLELGTGFNPELTGFENIYFSGALMGYTRAEMDEKVDEILCFADIGEFAYQPVKSYSSGMFARLAFSMATSIKPEILIIDEALSVGDMFFQAKSMARMKSMIEDTGTTLLFVSHDTSAVKAICNKALFIENGKLIQFGDTAEVTDAYLHSSRNSTLDTETVDEGKEPMALEYEEIFESVKPWERDRQLHQSPAVKGFKRSEVFTDRVKEFRKGSGGARLTNLELLNAKGEIQRTFEFNELIVARAYIEIIEPVKALNCCLLVRNRTGIDILHVTTAERGHTFPEYKGGEKIVLDFSFRNILRHNQEYSLHYTINNTFSFNDQETLDLIEVAEVFKSVYDGKNAVWHEVWYPFGIEYNEVQ